MVNKINLTLSQLAAFDIFQGYHKVNWNPQINYFLLGRYRKIDIYNLNKTYIVVKRLTNVISDILTKKGKFWFVNENFDIFRKNEFLKNLIGISPQLQFYNEKWLKGSLTNFRFVRRFSSNKFPHAIFVPNMVNNQFIINECFGINIPSIALTDTIDNPTRVFYPIPSNSRSMMSILFFYFFIAKVSLQSKSIITASFLFNSYRKIFLGLIKPLLIKKNFLIRSIVQQKRSLKKKQGFQKVRFDLVYRYFISQLNFKRMRWLECFFNRYQFLLHNLRFLVLNGKLFERFIIAGSFLREGFKIKDFIKKRKKKSKKELLVLKRNFLSWNTSLVLAGNFFVNSLYLHILWLFREYLVVNIENLRFALISMRIINI